MHQMISVPSSPYDLQRYIDQEPLKIRAQVIEAPRHAPAYVALQMKSLSIFSQKGDHPASGRFQLFIAESTIPFVYGDQLEMTLRLRRPKQYQNPGTFLYADYQKRLGIQGMAWLPDSKNIKKVGEGGNPFLKMVYQWREHLRLKIRKTIKDPSASLLLAMLIGESGYLNDETREVFTNAGLAHLLAVSGTHLAFIALLVFAGSRWLILRLPEHMLLKVSTRKLPAQWASLPTALTVTFYAFLAGGKISTLRALTMILIYLFSIWLGRRRDLNISLAIAALFILLIHPRAIFDLSFLLSFIAVLSILLCVSWRQKKTAASNANKPLETAPPWVKRYILKPASLIFLTSLSAAIGTAPLTLYFFHQFSWAGLISNLLLTPIVGWILIPLSLTFAALSLFTETFLLPAWHEQAWSSFFRFTRFFADLPGADLHFPSPSLTLIVLFYSSLIFMLSTGKSQKTILLTTLAFFTLFLGWGALRLPPEKLRVNFLDVGQGDATFIEFPKGQTMLIDGGNPRAGKYAIAPFLWQRGIRSIDTLVTTHPQFDHIGGLPFILQNFKVKTVWTNGFPHETDTFRTFTKTVEESGTKHLVVTREKPSQSIENCQFVFLNPSERRRLPEDSLNNDSIVFRMSCSQKQKPPVSFLFTGDIEKDAEAELLKSPVEVKSTILKVPHHGSHSSSGAQFISAVSPQIALFSSGRNNRYQHPHPEIIERYKEHGARRYRTDQEGAIIIEIDDGLSISTYQTTHPLAIKWSGNIFTQEWENIKKLFIPF